MVALASSNSPINPKRGPGPRQALGAADGDFAMKRAAEVRAKWAADQQRKCLGQKVVLTLFLQVDGRQSA